MRTILLAILNLVTRRAVQRKCQRGYQWQQISILDARTSRICRRCAFAVRDAEFRPVGHGLPFAGGVPRHLHLWTEHRHNDTPAMTLAGWMEAAERER